MSCLALQDEVGFMKQLEVVRNDLMAPLAAASMEMGSYQRGYSYIVRLGHELKGY